MVEFIFRERPPPRLASLTWSGAISQRVGRRSRPSATTFQVARSTPHDHEAWGGKTYNLAAAGATWIVAHSLAGRRREVRNQESVVAYWRSIGAYPALLARTGTPDITRRGDFRPGGSATKSNRWLFRNPPARLAGGFPALIISPATAEAATTATPPAAGACKVRARRPSFIDGQRAALEGLSIQPCDCFLNVFTFGEFDKAEASRRPCHLVANHHRRGHLKARAGYKLAERRIGSAVG